MVRKSSTRPNGQFNTGCQNKMLMANPPLSIIVLVSIAILVFNHMLSLKYYEETMQFTLIRSGQIVPIRTLKHSAKATWDYCWINSIHFQNDSFLEDRHYLTVNGIEQIVPSREVTTWHVHFHDRTSGLPVLQGGSVIRVLINGSSLCRPRVIDMRNGTYEVTFQIFDEGSYTAYTSLRWLSCRGYVFCNPEDLGLSCLPPQCDSV